MCPHALNIAGLKPDTEYMRYIMCPENKKLDRILNSEAASPTKSGKNVSSKIKDNKVNIRESPVMDKKKDEFRYENLITKNLKNVKSTSS